jgi:hypothetical protein
MMVIACAALVTCLCRDKKSESLIKEQLLNEHDTAIVNTTTPPVLSVSSTSTSASPSTHRDIERHVVESFVRHRDGGYTAWRFKQHPILPGNRNQSFYK